jgi:hypothetical protein
MYPDQVSVLVCPSYSTSRYQSRPDVQGIIHRAASLSRGILHRAASRIVRHYASRGIIIARYSQSRGIIHRAASHIARHHASVASSSRGIRHRAASSSCGIIHHTASSSRGIILRAGSFIGIASSIMGPSKRPPADILNRRSSSELF